MTTPTLKKLVLSALLAAMTCIATMLIKIPTPTLGYIHLGDGFVLLCGILLGPWSGALAAGIGSMFSDIFSGYASWAIPTLLIKALTACTAGLLFHKLRHMPKQKKQLRLAVVLSGLVGETLMVFGYFAYETVLAALGSGAFHPAALAAGIASAAAGIPFNVVQGTAGILIAVLLLPILQKIPYGRLSETEASASRLL